MLPFGFDSTDRLALSAQCCSGLPLVLRFFGSCRYCPLYGAVRNRDRSCSRALQIDNGERHVHKGYHGTNSTRWDHQHSQQPMVI